MTSSLLAGAGSGRLAGRHPGYGDPARDGAGRPVSLALWAEDPVGDREHECAAGLLFSDEALMRLVGFNAQQVRPGGVPAGGGQAAGAAHRGAHLSGHAGREHRAS